MLPSGTPGAIDGRLFMRRLGIKCRWAAVCVDDRAGHDTRLYTGPSDRINFGLRNGRMAWAGGTSPIWLCGPGYVTAKAA